MNPSKSNPSQAFAFRLGFSHLAFCALVQIENFALFRHPPGSGVEKLFHFILQWPFLQFENALVSILLGLGARAVSRWRLGRLAACGVFALLGLLVALDQISVGTFGDHLRFSYTEGHSNFGLMLGSVLSAATWCLPANLLLLLLVVGFFTVTALRAEPESFQIPSPTSSPIRWSFVQVLLGGAWLAICAVTTPSRDAVNLQRHPLPVLLEDRLENSVAIMPPAPKIGSLQKLQDGSFVESATEAARLSKASAILGHGSRLPNILLVVLESVGAHQLLDGETGLPDLLFAPNIRGLADHAVLFDTLYTTFPGTVRSHLAMMTGGTSVTWGSVFEEMTCKSRLPTLVGELGRLGFIRGAFAGSDLQFENLDQVYSGFGFDHLFHVGTASEAFRVEQKLDSWSCREDAVASLALAWVDETRPRGKPFFLTFLPDATHHPYSWPEDFAPPTSGSSDEERYSNALAFSDHAVGSLLKGLEERGLSENLLVIVTGDHGEAFGHRHPANVLHKNFLYEENIRTFLLIHDRRLPKDTLVSHRIGSIGDVTPTILGLFRQPFPSSWSQNLLSPDWRPSIPCFHKNAHPELWGLRDGKWKYIAHKTGSKLPELYNLETDPEEQRNLAPQARQERLNRYDALCAGWFVRVNDDFIRSLSNPPLASGVAGLRPQDMLTSGPKVLAIGVEDSQGFFTEKPRVSSSSAPIAWTQWVSYTEDHLIKTVWTSPAGATFSSQLVVKPDWSRTQVPYPGPYPMREGRWVVTLYEGPEKLLERPFQVGNE